ncbi:MAG: terminase family protein [candidate division Zixibacteria bacterium]|nr:terminase family protein [candidate division Zixibacteria bacterium]
MDWERGFFDPAYFASAVLGIKLHTGQKQWLQGSSEHENALVTGNRWGKSFVSAVKIVHHALYRPRQLKFDACGRYRIITASITQDQANIIFDQAVRFIRQSALLKPLVKSITRTPYPKMTFGNGATVEARSTQNRGEYLLGNDYDLFIFDEVAFETDPEYVVEEVIQMRLADREGLLDLVSTPNGRNWFCQRVQDILTGKRPGYVQSGDSRENNYISRNFLDERVRYFTERRLQQNIMGQFVDSGGEILKGAYIDAAITGKQRGLFSTPNNMNETGENGTRLLSGWDLARKRTATVGVTVEVSEDNAQVVELERFRMFDWQVVISKIKQRQIKYPGQLVIDATGLGDVVAEQLREYNPLCVVFTAATKAELLTNVELFHAQGRIFYQRWELPDGSGRIWSLEDELRSARWDDNNECDALMALALALWPLRRRSRQVVEPRVGML